MALARLDHIAAAMEGNFQGLLDELTTKEKIAFLAGANFWETAAVERLGILLLKVRSHLIRGALVFFLANNLLSSAMVPMVLAEERSLTVPQQRVFLLAFQLQQLSTNP
jgi:hypothetical protein